MANTEMSNTWTPNKVTRLKQLILRHVANGGTVHEACEQFEFETNSIHRARANHMKWVLSIRHTCRDEFRQAVEQGQTVRLKKLGDGSIAELPVEEDAFPSTNDELADRLFATVAEFVEDRRDLSSSVDDLKVRLERSEIFVQELEDARKLDQMRYDKKTKEYETLEQQLADLQTRYSQEQSDHEQLKKNSASDYYRLQVQFKESKMQFDDISSEFRKFQATSRRETELLESQLRDTHTRYEQLATQYELSRQDNARLTKRITDFAQQITSMVPNTDTTAPIIASVPIRSTVVSNE